MHTKRSALTAIAGAAVLAAGCGGEAAQKPERARSAQPMTVVPNLVGVEQGRARRLAGSRGFGMQWRGFVGRLANGHTNVTCAKVHSQSPVAGERRPRGAAISVLEIACTTPTGRWHDAAGVDER